MQIWDWQQLGLTGVGSFIFVHIECLSKFGFLDEDTTKHHVRLRADALCHNGDRDVHRED